MSYYYEVEITRVYGKGERRSRDVNWFTFYDEQSAVTAALFMSNAGHVACVKVQERQGSTGLAGREVLRLGEEN